MIKRTISSYLEKADELCSSAYLRLFRERNSLIIFVFHCLFRNKREINSDIVRINPLEAITTNHFRRFVGHYLKHNYTFVSPDDILNGLNSDKNYILATFDDGYYNNHLALPILNEFSIPAVFFISTSHVTENKSFWWDIIYRERRKKGISFQTITNEQAKLKNKTSEEIEKYIIDMFGESALRPIGDIDRPFTSLELRDFSKEKNVFIGNHTSNHAILTNYTPIGIKSEILSAQNILYNITGAKPNIIAYPNGNFSGEIVNISREIGLKLGVTTIYKKNYLPISFKDDSPLTLNRFVLQGYKLDEQCELYRSDIQLMFAVNRLMGKS